MFEILCLLVLGLSALSGSDAEMATGSGSCPSYNAFVPFDYTRFVGEWYAIQQTTPDDKCLTYSISFVKRGKLRLLETAYETPQKLKYSKRKKLKFDGESTSTMTLHSDTGMLSSKFKVLATDYQSYAVVFICKGQLINHRKSLEIWSRGPTFNPVTVQQIHSYLVAQGVSLEGLDVVDQSSCRLNFGLG